jgi:hypothetical protein
MSAYRRLTRVVLLGVLAALVMGAAPAHAAVVLADSYPESNFTSSWPVYGPNYSQVGQSFTATAGALDSAVFYLRREAGSAGYAYALLYAHSGAFGVDGVPSGAPLATSSPVDVTTLADSARQLVTFHFDNTVTLTAGSKYVIVMKYEGTWPNPLVCYFDADSSTHEGNAVAWFTDHWIPRGATDDTVFYVYQTPPTPMPVYRFYRPSTGTHFYTADPAEMARVRDTMASTFTLEGVGYTINTSNPANSVPLYRFFNRRTGTHLYTADPVEKANIQTRLSSTYSLDGVAYKVSTTSGTPVVRFYSPSKGVHFYSSDPNEIANVRTKLGAIWLYEGPAYRVAQ